MNKIESVLFDNFIIGDNSPTLIMGVLNLSPESFYKSSIYETFESIREAALKMISSGALILDVGARSTAPKSPVISVDEERNRLEPILEKLCEILPDNLLLSVDTQFARIAQAAYRIASRYNKRMILNDVSGLTTDPDLINFITKNNIPLILMASKDKPGDLLTIDEIIQQLRSKIQLLNDRGYDEKKIIIDPGIGHWVKDKTYQYDLKIIANLEKLRTLQKPILIALSRKSFIGEVLEIPDPEDRLMGSLCATAVSVFNGAHIVRTHDVNKKLKDIVKMAEAIRRSR
ncbi:MAG: Dihydropteroate synthase [Promethearchaeota archaeon]|nr:MAG: Dihydropteroate synthase [Candidatus Lokiarchaeota archaeon]